MEEENLEVLEGSFIKTIYNSPSYMVSLFYTSDGTITITGPSFEFDKSSKYTLVGRYVNHPKYGFQFEMVSVSKYLPSAKEEVIKFLASPAFKGIGKKAAEKVYEVYGDESLHLLKNDLSLIDKINLSDKQKYALKDGFIALNDEINDSFFSLINLGYSSKEAHLILNKYKSELDYVLKDNPYKFYLDCYGISFNKTCECLKKLNFENKEAKYKQAYLIYIFKEISFKTGDIYLYEEDFRHYYEKYFNDFYITVESLIDDNYLCIDNNRYYLTDDYLDEKFIANYLNTFINNELLIDDVNLNDAIKQNSRINSIEYDESQTAAIKNFFNHNFSLIIGGPGTGKTTIIKALVEIFTDYFPFNNLIVIAPTGRAAKRINEICNVPSKTIHSLLRWNKEDNTFVFNENNPLLYDAIIIDEFSMVDNQLFASLLKASSRVKKICIIGDDNQLPSVRQGNLLYDLINSNCFTLTRLNTIHRQKNGNEIINLASEIVEGNINYKNYLNDVTFIDINNFNKDELIKMIENDINQGISLDDIQVLSPMYRGEYGIDALNQALQLAFNPKSINKNEKRIADCLYRENDKILQLKNRPDDDVYNGDIGILEDIDDQEKQFLINYNDIYIYYSYDDLIDITLAYAMSVHKAQGSEYNTVYLLCSKQHYHMLYKKLIYTAISRAKNKLVLITDKQILNSAINKDEVLRKTTLIERIKENEK